MKQHMFEETLKIDGVICSKRSFKPVVIVKEEAWKNPQTQVFHPRKFYKTKDD